MCLKTTRREFLFFLYPVIRGYAGGLQVRSANRLRLSPGWLGLLAPTGSGSCADRGSVFQTFWARLHSCPKSYGRIPPFDGLRHITGLRNFARRWTASPVVVKDNTWNCGSKAMFCVVFPTQSLITT